MRTSFKALAFVLASTWALTSTACASVGQHEATDTENTSDAPVARSLRDYASSSNLTANEGAFNRTPSNSAPSFSTAEHQDSDQYESDFSSALDYDTSVKEFRELLDQSHAENTPVGRNVRKPASNPSLMNVRQVREFLSSRGFEEQQAPLEASSDVDGYVGSYDVDLSDEFFVSPSFTAHWTSPSGVMWSLYVNDNELFAIPISYGLGLQSTFISKELIFSELPYVIQYDSFLNEYSDFDADAVEGESARKGEESRLLQVNRIDAQTLSMYSPEALKNL